TLSASGVNNMSDSLIYIIFLYPRSIDRCGVHSFPTRRSSDLKLNGIDPGQSGRDIGRRRGDLVPDPFAPGAGAPTSNGGLPLWQGCPFGGNVVRSFAPGAVLVH